MVFSYKALDKSGAQVTGTREAADKGQVIAYLKAQHMTPISIKEGVSALNKELTLVQSKPKAKDLSMFCEQFCSLLRAGVTIMDALRLLGGQQKKSSMLYGAIQTTISSVNEGETLGNAMAKSPKCFDSTLVNLVRAGEASGSLDKSLERMSVQYKKDAELAATVKKAMSYPIIVMIVAIIVVIAMLVFVVPRFMKMFADIGIEMPALTMAMVGASNWLVENWKMVLLIVIGVGIAFFLFVKSKFGHKVFSKLAITIPVVKMLTINTHAAKIARTLSTLLTAGMTVIEALTILESTVNNYYYKEAIKAVREDVLTGRPMNRKFQEMPNLFPTMLTHMITVGEDTGDISAMLNRTADYYELEVETATQTLTSMIQPAVILFLACTVGVVLAAVLMPMVTMYQELGDAL